LGAGIYRNQKGLQGPERILNGSRKFCYFEEIIMADPEKLSYLCPWCMQFILKVDFKNHQAGQHRNTPGLEIEPESLEDIERRFFYLGMWEEK
jgi:hypothetical protein